jgi:hypothetical protein
MISFIDQYGGALCPFCQSQLQYYYSQEQENFYCNSCTKCVINYYSDASDTYQEIVLVQNVPHVFRLTYFPDLKTILVTDENMSFYKDTFSLPSYQHYSLPTLRKIFNRSLISELEPMLQKALEDNSFEQIYLKIKEIIEDR